MVEPFGQVYRGKRVLVTGHTGFKGGWLSLWLRELGAGVSGLALPVPEGLSFFSTLPEGTFQRSWLKDMRGHGLFEEVINEVAPDIVFHLAAQPLVGVSYREPLDTFTTNTLGTALLLEALRTTQSPASAVIVTSDKCYRNDNAGRPFREGDPLGGHDIYSMSKAATELVAASWHTSFFAQSDKLGRLATARAGTVIGGGDYAEDRIVPDAVRASLRSEPLVLRRPQATRPWQHVLESVSGYLALGARLLSEPRNKRDLISLNFGPDSESERSVQELVDAWLVSWPGAFEVEGTPQPAYGEAARLSLDHSLARQTLGWSPAWDFSQAVGATASWYRHRHEKSSPDEAMAEYSRGQIHSYVRDATAKGAAWTRQQPHPHE